MARHSDVPPSTRFSTRPKATYADVPTTSSRRAIAFPLYTLCPSPCISTFRSSLRPAPPRGSTHAIRNRPISPLEILVAIQCEYNKHMNLLQKPHRALRVRANTMHTSHYLLVVLFYYATTRARIYCKPIKDGPRRVSTVQRPCHNRNPSRICRRGIAATHYSLY